ncbi:hypothetical protein JW898_04675 [Candidatus Woesearchaeota archaeon]|nr:hypothetical protein [Candidatus Woesearchaeota archaeon]
MPKAPKQKKDEKKAAVKLTDKERVDKGEVLARTIIEVLGAPKDYVEEAIQVVVDKLHKTEGFEVVSESTYEAEEKGKLFSTFSEMEIWFKDVDALSKFIFDFTPSSVEIVQPSKLSLSALFVSGFLNDFLLKMHDMGLKLKDTAAKSQLLQKNTDALVRNFLNFMLKEPRSAEEIANMTGIPEENADAILSNFLKAGVVEKKGEGYVLLKKK